MFGCFSARSSVFSSPPSASTVTGASSEISRRWYRVSRIAFNARFVAIRNSQVVNFALGT
jgi:hypothetical protein